MALPQHQLISTLRQLRSRGVLHLLTDLYHRAPASVGTFGGLLLTYLLQRTWEDYCLWYSLGPGGLLPRSIWGYLVHQVFVLPISLPKQVCRSDNSVYLPPDHRNTEPCYLKWGINKRRGGRPATKGCLPHRCISQRVIASDAGDDERSQAVQHINAHLKQIQSAHPTLLSLSSSLLEAHTSPALFHTPSAIALGPGAPSPLATFYTSLLPSREFAHYHDNVEADGSLHLVLSPSDARIVIEKEWGELHPLAGFGLSGFWFPFLSPGWKWCNLPLHIVGTAIGLFKGGEAGTRWGKYPPVLTRNVDAESTRRSKGGRQRADRRRIRLPPTYMLIYPPTMMGIRKQTQEKQNQRETETGLEVQAKQGVTSDIVGLDDKEEMDDEVETVNRIIDASASFVLGFDVQRHTRPEIAHGVN